MKRIKVIDRDNLPMKPPFTFTLLVFVYFKVFDISDFWKGAIVLLMGIVWLAWAYTHFVKQETVDIFKEEK
jgi:hypothetical protein